MIRIYTIILIFLAGFTAAFSTPNIVTVDEIVVDAILSDAKATYTVIEGRPVSVYLGDNGRYLMVYADVGKGRAMYESAALHVWYDGCTVSPELPNTTDHAKWQAQTQAMAGTGTESEPWAYATNYTADCRTAAASHTLQAETTVSYVNGSDYLTVSTAVCGGRSGDMATAGLISSRQVQEQNRQTMVFDHSGCATFDVLWQYGFEPQAPTALELSTASAVGGTDDVTYRLAGTFLLVLFGITLLFWRRVMVAQQ